MGFWSDLHEKMKQDFAAQNWATKSYQFEGPGMGRARTFNTPAEFLDALDRVEKKARAEAGTFNPRSQVRPF